MGCLFILFQISDIFHGVRMKSFVIFKDYGSQKMSQNYDNLIPSVHYFVEKQCAPNWKGICIIDFYDLTYVHKGVATYIINDRPYTLQPGDIIYVPKGSRRQVSTDPGNPMYCYAFNFQLHFLDRQPVDLPFPTVIHIGRNDYLLSLLNQFNFIWLEKNEDYILKSRAIFMLIIHYLISVIHENQTVFSADKRTEKVKAYILNNYQNKIDCNQLAELVNVNPVYLGSLFKKATGTTIKEYITRIRIHKACDLLSSGDYSISETASHCGFDDIFYFSKVFKKVIGIAPSKFSTNVLK
jgi:AraC-type DNA-binding domain-containing proteins